MVVSESVILANLEKVIDPELNINVVSLGLIRSVLINKENDVIVIMTLTCPTCSFSEIIKLEAEFAVRAVPGTANVKIEITFDPPWDPSVISDEAKLELGIL